MGSPTRIHKHVSDHMTKLLNELASFYTRVKLDIPSDIKGDIEITEDGISILFGITIQNKF